VGSTPAGIVYSEWALANPEARGYLRPILAENNGWQMFITTPRGRNHAHRTLMAAMKTAGSFGQILSATDTSVFSAAQLEIEKEAYVNEYGDEIGLSKFEQEYLCSFEAANLGAILARQIGLLEKAGRIGPHVEFDPYGAPIQISSDIGRADSSTWWFWQPKVGGYSVIDYEGGFGIDADAWCDKLEEKLSSYTMHNGKPALGKIWLPHDARAKTFAAKHSAIEIFIKRFGADRVGITPDSKKKDRVNAARVLIKRVEFSDKCDKGLDGLRAWAYEWDAERKIFSLEPKHDWASHDGDGFSYGAIIMNMVQPPPAEVEPEWMARGMPNGVIRTATLDQLWQTAKPKDDRI